MISLEIVDYLVMIGINYLEVDVKGIGFVLIFLFNFESLSGIFMVVGGGFLVGFGVCYGDGCILGYVILGLVYF